MNKKIGKYANYHQKSIKNKKYHCGKISKIKLKGFESKKELVSGIKSSY